MIRAKNIFVFRIGFAIIAALALAIAASSQDLPLKLNQYAHTAWRVQDGTFIGLPSAIAQTADGYLWIGTSKGPQRYDGSRFVDMHMPPGKVNLPPAVLSMVGAKDGSLWIATTTSVGHFDKGVFSYLPVGLMHPNQLIEDHRGTIWLARSRDKKGALCSIRGTSLQCPGQSDGFNCPYSNALTEDQSGTIWIGSSTICAWKDGHVQGLLPSNPPSTGAKQQITAFATAPDGSILVGWDTPGFGLQRLAAGKLTPVVLPGFDGSTLGVESLLVDREGSLWVGTDSQGLFHITNGVADHYASTDGLSGDRVLNILEDREGSIWVATREGVDQFHKLSVVSFGTKQGLTSSSMFSILPATDNTVIAGSTNGLQVLGHGTVSNLLSKVDPPDLKVKSIYQDGKGDLWLNASDKLERYSKGRTTVFNRPSGDPIGQIIALTGDRDNTIWGLATGEEMSLFRVDVKGTVTTTKPPDEDAYYLASSPDGKVWLGSEFGNVYRFTDTTPERIPSPQPKLHYRGLVADTPQSLWFPSNQGLFRWQQGEWFELTSKNGLPCNDVFSVVTDLHGALWVNQPCGFFQISKQAIENWESHPEGAVTGRLFSLLDGAQNAGTNFTPEFVRSTDGKLWLANQTSLQMIDPDHLQFNSLPPPIHIEALIADRKTYAPSLAVQLPAFTRDITIDYSALSFKNPRSVRFRYRLSNVDKDWQDVADRHQAFYMNLPPGKYHFQVIACNNDGVWNLTGDQLTFIIRPGFYQTVWFRVFAVIIALLAIWLAFRMRLRAVTSQIEARMGERLMERDRIARELHDTLLQGFQGLLLQLQTTIRRIPVNVGEREAALSALNQGDEILMQGRDRVRDLRSREGNCGPLVEMLRQTVDQLRVPTGPELSFVVEGVSRDIQLFAAEELTLFAREALSNAVRHAQATSIRCELLFRRASLTLILVDDGKGIPVEWLQPTGKSGHWGLQGMRERADKLGATFKLGTSERGTRIELRVPAQIAYFPSRSGVLRYFGFSHL